jgi:myo-inositol-1(or 4)-monophosphatase
VNAVDDLDSLLDIASRLARDAGALLLEGRASARVDDDNVATNTTPTDLVSDMDRASEQLLVEGLGRARPDDAIVAEEGASREGSSGVRWIIDPLDGTTNYLYGHPAWGVSIAAEVDGEGVVGVVYDPTRDELFSGAAGRGARCNGEPVKPSDATDLSQSLVATGFSYLPERRAQQARMLATVLPAVRDIRRMGAATLDLCWVACGRVDAYYESGLQPWDLAAGAVIAAAGGARVEGLEGPVPESGSALAATPALLDPLRALLGEAAAAAS